MNLSRNNRVKYSGSFGRQRKKGGHGFKNLKWKFYDSEALVGDRWKVLNKDKLVSASGLCQLELGSTTTTGTSACHSDVEFRHQSPLQSPKCAMKSATKLDTCKLKLYGKNCHFLNRLQHIENHQIEAPLVPFALQVELMEAQKRLRAFEAEKELFKKKHNLRKISDERSSSWLKKECKEFCFVFEDLKDESKRERRKCKQIETVFSKLQNELIDVDTLGKEFAQKFDQEKKERMLVEDLCRKLEQENEGNKAKIKALECENSMIRVDMEQERKMLRMAELMREEHVHKKLMDAKLFLEEKYALINDLIVDLEIFLRSKDMDSNVLCEEHKNILANLERDFDSASCKETETFAGDVAFTFNPARSEGSVNAIGTGRNGSSGKRIHATNGDNESSNYQCSEVSSEPVKQLTSTEHTHTHNICELIEDNKRDMQLKEVSPHGEQQCSCSCSMNPHLGRAMKGCTEWPRAIQRSGLKSKLLESRFASQRIQMRGILKQKN